MVRNGENYLKNKKSRGWKKFACTYLLSRVLYYPCLALFLLFFRMSELQQKTFPFPLGSSESSSSGSKSSALQIRAHRRAALSMNETGAAVGLRHPPATYGWRGNKERERDGELSEHAPPSGSGALHRGLHDALLPCAHWWQHWTRFSLRLRELLIPSLYSGFRLSDNNQGLWLKMLPFSLTDCTCLLTERRCVPLFTLCFLCLLSCFYITLFRGEAWFELLLLQ